MKFIRTLAALSGLLLALALAGCGSDDSDDKDDASDLFGDLPACSDVWQVGETLDLDEYEGCDDDGETEIAVSSGCYDDESNYRGQVASYNDELWVLQEGTDPKTGEGGTPGKVTDEDPGC